MIQVKTRTVMPILADGESLGVPHPPTAGTPRPARRRQRVGPGGRRRDERGITLIELMVVVVIIAIVAAIAVTLFQDVQKKARLAADRGVGAALRSAVAMYYGAQAGNFPPGPATLEKLVQPSPPVFNCNTYTYDPANGRIELTPNDIAKC